MPSSQVNDGFFGTATYGGSRRPRSRSRGRRPRPSPGSRRRPSRTGRRGPSWWRSRGGRSRETASGRGRPCPSTVAIRGINSPTRRPVTLVGMDLYLPRTSSAASGFRSKRVVVGEPAAEVDEDDGLSARDPTGAVPQARKRRRPERGPAVASSPGDATGRTGRGAPTRRKLRRETPLHRRVRSVPREMSNMVHRGTGDPPVSSLKIPTGGSPVPLLSG